MNKLQNYDDYLWSLPNSRHRNLKPNTQHRDAPLWLPCLYCFHFPFKLLWKKSIIIFLHSEDWLIRTKPVVFLECEIDDGENRVPKWNQRLRSEPLTANDTLHCISRSPVELLSTHTRKSSFPAYVKQISQVSISCFIFKCNTCIPCNVLFGYILLICTILFPLHQDQSREIEISSLSSFCIERGYWISPVLWMGKINTYQWFSRFHQTCLKAPSSRSKWWYIMQTTERKRANTHYVTIFRSEILNILSTIFSWAGIYLANQTWIQFLLVKTINIGAEQCQGMGFLVDNLPHFQSLNEGLNEPGFHK